MKNVTPAPKAKLHVKKGDTVRVMTGPEDVKGKQGRILKIVKKKDRFNGEIQYRAIVEGLNLKTKHEKPKSNDQPGARKETEGSIHISNLMLLDPKSGIPTRIGRTKTTKGWVRVSKKSGEVIK
jgi:large subunit ribosomal protein L24